jgi:hypothetical protein
MGSCSGSQCSKEDIDLAHKFSGSSTSGYEDESDTASPSSKVTTWLEKPIELPDLTPIVVQALLAGRSAEVWGAVIRQMVDFYTKNYPNLLCTTNEYQEIGKRFFKLYPTIERHGTHPWVREALFPSNLYQNYTMHIRYKFNMDK